MPTYEQKARAVDRLAVRIMKQHNESAGMTGARQRSFSEARAEAVKVARRTDASDADRRKGMAGNIEAKRARSDAAMEARERAKDTSSRPGESKPSWLARMRSESGFGGRKR